MTFLHSVGEGGKAQKLGPRHLTWESRSTRCGVVTPGALTPSLRPRRGAWPAHPPSPLSPEGPPHRGDPRVSGGVLADGCQSRPASPGSPIAHLTNVPGGGSSGLLPRVVPACRMVPGEVAVIPPSNRRCFKHDRFLISAADGPPVTAFHRKDLGQQKRPRKRVSGRD